MSGKERLGGAQAIVSGVLEEFRGLSARPHGSGQEAAETAYFMDRLRRLGLTPERDEAGNVRADVPPTPGHESAPLLILQGHMDMVCTAAPGSSFDPVRDTVTIVTEDGFLRSDGRSSLGADNNLGNAVVLYLLKEGVPHGPLRLLFTVSEEVGLQGAAQVDPKWLEGAAYLLNTDGFHLGLAVTGSAGGRRETYTRPLAWCAPQGTEGFRITLTGGLGGHSGDDIHRGRLNAVVALAQLLEKLSTQFSLEVADFTGGSGHNAIPGSAQVTVILPAGQGNALAAACAEAERDLLARYGAAEPDIRLTAAPIPCPAQVWQAESRKAVCGLLTGLFCGVYAMHHAFPDVVGASANVGQVFMENSTAVVRAFIRCARPEEESILFPQHDSTAQTHGFALTEVTAYPSWPGQADSPLVHTLCQVYRAETGRNMTVTAVHVGLEPSVLGAKNPAMVMVSTGPDIVDAHAVTERAPLAGIPDYTALLAGTLAAL